MVKLFTDRCLWENWTYSLLSWGSRIYRQTAALTNTYFMIRKFSEQLLKSLHREITDVREQEADAFKVLSAILKLVRASLKKLREHIQKHPLLGEAEIIHFYKNIKPAFESLYIYELEFYNLVASAPAGDAEVVHSFYKDELQVVQRFFRHIAFHYGYYRLQATELDALLFVPGASAQSILVPEAPELDPEFATAGSYLYAKIKAFELLQTYLIRRLNGSAPVADLLAEQFRDAPQWTGEQVNLVELAYGLYYTGQLNNGNAEVKDIIALLELVFRIKLNSAYHVFGNIRRRKMYSPTRFLDKMRDSIQQRVDDDLAYKPAVKRKRPASEG